MPARLITMMFLGGWFAANACGQAIDEYQVKAAFVLNFAKFIEWPPQAFLTPRDPVTICVLGHNSFGRALEETIHGKSIEGRAFVYRQVSDAEGANACQILFVASSERKHFRSLCAGLKAAGMLTVGEADGFAAQGAVINFKLDDGRVRFEINVDAAEHQQLHISAKLLGLAQIVKSEKNQ
jgi:YfiR/HmsC-like